MTTASEPVSSASAAAHASPSTVLTEIPLNTSNAIKDEPEATPRCSRSPLRPPPIITEDHASLRGAGSDVAGDSSDSPLSVLSSPPASPFDPTTPVPDEDTAHPYTHASGHVKEEQSNGNVHEEGSSSHEHPAKRRRLGRDSTPPPPGSKSRNSNTISPPWKKFEAAGPTTIIEGGKRKSGRLNTVSLEQLSSDKRITRKSYSEVSPPSSRSKSTSTNVQGQAAKRAASASKTLSSKTIPTLKHHARKSSGLEPRSTPSRPPTAQPSRSSTRTRRPSRSGFESAEPDHLAIQPSRSNPRIRLRVNRAPLSELPLLHPQRVLKKKLASSLKEYFEIADKIPLADGGQFDPEEEPPLTDEQIQAEAKIIIRIEDEVRPDGLLGVNCSIYQPEPAEEPPRQYAHRDHVIKAAMWLRKWMVKEQKDHREKAKRLAEACAAAWRARQPKSEEELEREARDFWIARYRVVMKAMFGTWDSIRLEVNRRRLENWEAEEQRRVKAALQEAVSRSEQQLLARQTQYDSEMTDDEHTDEDDHDLISREDQSQRSGEDKAFGDAIGSEDENNMSTSDEDDDRKSVASDEGLTQAQLVAKYADMPSLNRTQANHGNGGDVEMEDPTAADEDTSDESVDMDDDDTDTESSSDGDEESEVEVDQPSGLLGLFFGKKELEKLQDEKTQEGKADAPMADPGSTASAIIEKLQSVGSAVAGTNPSAAPEHSLSALAVGSQATANSERIFDQASQLPAMRRRRAVTPDKSRVLPPPEVEGLTPEAEANTVPASPERSHSPQTTDTKPSDADTATSVEPLSAIRDGSRSASPQVDGPRTEVPFLLRGTLREYQHYGLDWLAGLYANNTNGILADEMGLGKTIQTIALLAHLACVHEVWGPHLIIVPTSVILNWEMEFKKWCPGFKILTYYGTQEERKRKRQGWKNDDIWNVCITSYQIVLQDSQVFRRRRWHYMILDEAHNIKNFKSQRWQTLLGFNTHSRLLLTGTPLQNNLTELWSLLFFLMPNEDGVGGFADLKEFHDWFARPESQILEHGREKMDEEARAIISKLHKVLRPYLLRRLKADVEKQMPAKIEHVEFCRLSKRQRELYDGFLARNETRDTLSSGNYLSIINCLMQLRKVCNHPDLFADRPIMTSFRMDKSVASGYDDTERLVRSKLLKEDPMSKVNFSVMNMLSTRHEHLSRSEADCTKQLSAHDPLISLRDVQHDRAKSCLMQFDPSTVKSNVASLDSRVRWDRYQELLHLRYLNALGCEQRPIYGKQLREFLTIGLENRPHKPRPRVSKQILNWFAEDSFVLRTMIPTLDQRAQSLERTISKVACVTPAVVTRDMHTLLLGLKGVEAFTEADLQLSAPVRRLPFIPPEAPVDPWHESRMRLSIQFPDKRLLQYDCGKLQALDKLLRRLQAGGHRALIFTQMTKVLDILEQFLNIHGHKYLRLDGSTKVEQRQILCDRFNADTRILAFILSSRSGGLGLNLTGADTVIFYDQDWNPAMDKQCQDRCHRIGQTRDVHIYRLVSEHTIEANILRKASQKQMLDDVVIQEGEFTTDYFRNNGQVTVQDVAGRLMGEHDEAANAAMDLVLGGVEKTDTRTVTKALEHAEDTEDVIAARAAEREIQQDDADFSEAKPGSGAASTRQGTPREGPAAPDKGELDLVEALTVEEPESEPEYNAWGGRMRNIDDFMLGTMAAMLEGTPLELPKDKKKSRNRKGRDHRHR